MLDLNEVLERGLAKDRRPPDGLLHPSGDLVGPLRHTMLREAGAPEFYPNTIAGDLRMWYGTAFHQGFEKMLQDANVPAITELNVRKGLPEGWSGTADILLWDEDLRAFHLVDVKTQKGEGFGYIQSGGAKLEHVWQVSAYWHALLDMGYPLVNEAKVWYVPFNEDYRVEGGVQPITVSVTPLPKDPLWAQMGSRFGKVLKYLDTLPGQNAQTILSPGFFTTEHLAPVMAPEQKLLKKGDKYDVVLMPTWHAMFCPYHDDLCSCGTLPNGNKSQKLGTWLSNGSQWDYVPSVDVDVEAFPPGYRDPVNA